MLDILRKKSRTFGVYLVFAALIVIFAVGFGAVAPDQSCGGGPGTFRNVDFVEVDGETIDAALVRLTGDLTGDAPTARAPRPDFRYLARMADVGLYSAWSGTRFARDTETTSPIKLEKVTDDLVELKLVSAYARSLGLQVSQKELNESLALLLDNFRDEKTGAFQPQSYRGWLANLGTSVAGFENLIGDEILRERVIQMLVGEVSVSDAELEQSHRLENEKVTVEHIIIDDKTAAPLVAVTDAEVATWLLANADKAQAEYESAKAAKYTTPKTLTLRIIKVAAADPANATDDEQKAAFEEERKAARVKIDEALVSYTAKLSAPAPTPVEGEPEPAPVTPASAFAEVAAAVSDDPSKSNGGLVGDMKLPDLGRSPYEPAIGTAAAALTANTPSAVIDTPNAFWILFADTIKEETVTPFEAVKNEVGKGLVQATKVAEFKKVLADEVLAEAKKDPTKSLDDVVKAVHTKYGVTAGLETGRASFARLARFGAGIPATSPFLFEFGGRVPTLVQAGFAASAEKPLIDQVISVEDGRKFVIARFIEKTPAEAMTDDAKRDLRNTMVWERRRALYRGWYEDLLAKKMQEGDIDFSGDYETEKKTAEESFVQAGGKLPVKVAPATN